MRNTHATAAYIGAIARHDGDHGDHGGAVAKSDSLDLTGVARLCAKGIGWILPLGFRARARTTTTLGIAHPADVSDVYRTDIDEHGRTEPSWAFCQYCGLWTRKLTEDDAKAVNQAHPADEDGQPVAVTGDWCAGVAGIRCGESGFHEPAEPAAVRWWREHLWTFVTVTVEITDRTGRERGSATRPDIPAGTYPQVDSVNGLIRGVDIDPLADTGLLQELVDEAVRDTRTRHTSWWRKALPWR